jgi:hypothetical protein
MIHNSFHPDFFRQDTIMHPSTVDTTVRSSSESIIQAVVTDTALPVRQTAKLADSIRPVRYQKSLYPVQSADTIQAVKANVLNPFKKTFNASENFLINNSLNHLGKQSPVIMASDSLSAQVATISTPSSVTLQLQPRTYRTGDWVLLVIMIIVMLFIWIRIFYNKFFSFLANSLISYQLSAKVFREKNVLLKRVSFVLDVIYHIVLSFFLYESFTFLKLSPVRLTSYNLFLLFLNILILYTLIRSAVLKLFNYLFRTDPIISEYVHNNFIINKSIGIVLFPVTIAICYMPESFAGTLFVIGLVMLAAGIIFKMIRGYQIIIRKEVLFFYLILYLCTLEILPLLLGYKVFMSLL